MAAPDVLAKLEQFFLNNRDLNGLRNELLGFGISLVFQGAAVVLYSIAQQSTNSQHVLLGIIIIILGLLLLLMLAFVVDRFPQAGVLVIAVLRFIVFINR